MRPIALGLLAILGCNGWAADVSAGTPADACHVSSAPILVPVVELYTSEGCSSCPPADEWLAAVQHRSPSAAAPILLAFHVDYWDRLGWKDPWGQAQFSQRQEAYAQAGVSRGVYTPQVFVGARERPDWRALQELLQGGANPAALRPRLELALGMLGARAIEVRTTILPGSGGLPAGSRLILALTEDGLSDAVRAGENAGRQLTHAAVVRTWQSAPLAATPVSPVQRLSLADGQDPAHSHLVALLEGPTVGTLLQAVTLPWPAHCEATHVR